MFSSEPLKNAEIIEAIIEAINKINETPAQGGGAYLNQLVTPSREFHGGTKSVTKKDIIDTILLLLFFKKKMMKAGTTNSASTAAPAAPAAVGTRNTVYKSSKIDTASLVDTIGSIIKHLPNTLTTSTDHIIAKQNLARIIYFIALDACDSIVQNKGNTLVQKQFKSIQIKKGSDTMIVSTRIGDNNLNNILLQKKLFIIASSLAQNKLAISGDVTSLNSEPVLRFIGDIITEESVTKQSLPRVTFNTQLQQIKNTTQYTINLRVIQSVLLGHIVHEHDETAFTTTIFSQVDKDDIGKILKDLLTHYNINISSYTEPPPVKDE
jgi:hypothetical protein